jgi:hypothetical protein
LESDVQCLAARRVDTNDRGISGAGVAYEVLATARFVSIDRLLFILYAAVQRLARDNVRQLGICPLQGHNIICKQRGSLFMGKRTKKKKKKKADKA